jgi:hypothetical protein
VLIEDKASGTQLIQELIADGCYGVTRYQPDGDKTMRMHAQTAMIENGFVRIPEAAPWIAEYLHEMTVFPKGKHDDQVDSTAQFLDWFKKTLPGTEHLRVLPDPGRSGRAVPQTATRPNPMGPRLDGMARRERQSELTAAVPRFKGCGHHDLGWSADPQNPPFPTGSHIRETEPWRGPSTMPNPERCRLHEACRMKGQGALSC